MDRTVQNIHVLMTKDDLENINKKELPKGYSFCFYKDGMDEEWVNIQLRSKHILDAKEGEEYFKSVFLKNKSLLKERLLFIKDGAGNLVGTGAIWDGKHFPGDENRKFRLHWIAVDPDHGGKGLAKALISKLLETFRDEKMGDGLYLSTQTCSYVAIKIYLEFGFIPYDEKNNKKAWNIIYTKI